MSKKTKETTTNKQDNQNAVATQAKSYANKAGSALTSPAAKEVYKATFFTVLGAAIQQYTGYPFPADWSK